MSDPLVEFVVVDVDVVVFVCPSLLLVVVASYPPVIFVFEPDVFVCVFVSFANMGLAIIITINSVITCNQNFIYPSRLMCQMTKSIDKHVIFITLGFIFVCI